MSPWPALPCSFITGVTLPWPALAYHALLIHLWCHPGMPCHAHSSLVLTMAWPALTWPTLPCPGLLWAAQACPVLSYIVITGVTLAWPSLSCPALPYPALF